MSSPKHFNSGNVFGKLVGEVEHKSSKGGKPFISFEMNVSGAKCGSARAFCRMWDKERFEPFLAAVKKDPQTRFALKGFFGQYWDERNTVFSNFTIFEWNERDSAPRAAFILKGRVKHSGPVTSGQRILLLIEREGQEVETFELICPSERLLDQPHADDLIEVKGYLRQERPE